MHNGWHRKFRIVSSRSASTTISGDPLSTTIRVMNKYRWHMWFAWYPVWALYFDGKSINAKRCWLARVQRKRKDNDQVWEYQIT